MAEFKPTKDWYLSAVNTIRRELSEMNTELHNLAVAKAREAFYQTREGQMLAELQEFFNSDACSSRILDFKELAYLGMTKAPTVHDGLIKDELVLKITSGTSPELVIANLTLKYQAKISKYYLDKYNVILPSTN